MNKEKLNRLLDSWDDACVYAHGGNARQYPMLVATRLIMAGDALARALRELDEQRRRDESAGEREETRG